MQATEVERGFLFATALMAFDLVIGFAASVLFPPTIASTVAGGAAFLEVGVLLVTGGCLMSRQPIQNKDRYTEDGSISKAWRIALIGRQLLITALIVFLYTALLAVATLLSLF
jgi:hypothetical protein